MPYKSLTDFSSLTLKFGTPGSLNYGYLATPKFTITPSDFFEDDFLVIYRRSEFSAQKEVVMAEIYKFLTGYAPEVYVVTDDKENFYIATRRIKNFEEGLAFFNKKTGYEKARNLAALHIISYFFAESDMHSGNYGTQFSNQLTNIFKIDNAESLNFDIMRAGLHVDALKQLPYCTVAGFHGVSENKIPKTVVQSNHYQREKMNIIQKIAKTDFKIFVDILDKHLTRDEFSHRKEILKHMLNMPWCTTSMATAFREEFNKINSKYYTHEALIAKLFFRHEQLKQILQHDDLKQDYSLANPNHFQMVIQRQEAMEELHEELLETVKNRSVPGH